MSELIEKKLAEFDEKFIGPIEYRDAHKKFIAECIQEAQAEVAKVALKAVPKHNVPEHSHWPKIYQRGCVECCYSEGRNAAHDSLRLAFDTEAKR